MNTKTMGWFFIFAVVIVLAIVCLPVALIWAVNTLFSTAIPVTLKTWAAAFLLSAPFAHSLSKK